MSIIVSINSFVNGIVWGPYMLALLVGTGIFLTVRSGFMQFRHFGTIFKNTVGILHTPEAHKKNEFGVSPFQAVMTALASTVGRATSPVLPRQSLSAVRARSFGCGSVPFSV